MSQALQPVRGTHDLLAVDFAAQQRTIMLAQHIAALYGYARIDTPIFEFSEVFHRTLGDTSDIVTKETYTFQDRGGESLTLRPEFTAAIVRAFLSNKLTQEIPFKCFYAGPAFRYERPQKGRMRQFHQIGCEVIGAAEPSADVEMIALGANILEALGLKDSVTLELNSLGDAGSRAAYREALVAYLAQHKDKLSADSLNRLERNPLRILDSKDEGDRSVIAHAPTLSGFFSEESTAHFTAVQEGLTRLGITFKVSEKLVRGLDYYSHTVFEFTTDKLGAQGTVLAGGRYNDLVSLMGGPEMQCIGWAAGVERLVSLLGEMKPLRRADIAVIPMQEETVGECWSVTQQLRRVGFAVDMAYKGKAGKRLERANKLACRAALMVGADEVKAGTITLKNLATGEQSTFPLTQLVEALKKVLQ